MELANLFKAQMEKVSAMSKRDRNALLCQLVVKQELNTIMPDEIIQLEFIQAIRLANGEIAAVLKGWEENPETDPRNPAFYNTKNN